MKNMNWLYFALLTVACWGLYGIFLHAGQVGMADKVARPLQGLPFRRHRLLPDRRARAPA